MAICSIENCDKKTIGRGLCSAHYQAFRRYGDPLLGAKYNERGSIPKWIDELIINDTDECVKWPFSLQSNGYGTVTINGKATIAHRHICTMVHGPPPFERAIVRHVCGNGMDSCVNPKHLLWGTYQENADDCLAMGKRARGETQGSSILKEYEVLEIYERVLRGENQYDIADDYGVKQTQVSRIKLGKQWSWLTGAKLNAA